MGSPELAVRAAHRCADARRVMLNAWNEPQFGRSYALDLMGIDPVHLEQRHVDFADVVRRTCAESLADAVLYLADEEMTALVDVAAPTMPDQVLREDDLLSPHGFLWFAEPLPDRTGTVPVVPFEAIQWTLLAPGHPLLDRFRDEGPMSRGSQARGALGQPVETERTSEPYGVLINTYCDTVDYATARMAAAGQVGGQADLAPGAPGLIPSATVVWLIGSPIGTAFGRTVEDLAEEAGRTDMDNDPGFYQRALAAFWTLAKQPLTTTSDTPPGARPDRRRAARAGVKDPSAPVRVLRLRTTGGSGKEPGPGTGRGVSVRFAVRGHWRNQWLPSTKSHRQQWIAPYLKGPDSAPLLGGERVFLAQGRDGGSTPD